jgi:hypothetical protein
MKILKGMCIFIFWMFGTHGSLLVEWYIKVHKKIETIWWTFDKEKWLLKHDEFSWKFCSCKFENITYFKK